jgi:hypothetical protein
MNPLTISYIRDKNAKASELRADSIQNHRSSLFKLRSLLRRPAPSWPYHLSNTLLHRSDVQNIVVAEHVLPRMFAKADRY